MINPAEVAALTTKSAAALLAETVVANRAHVKQAVDWAPVGQNALIGATLGGLGGAGLGMFGRRKRSPLSSALTGALLGGAIGGGGTLATQAADDIGKIPQRAIEQPSTAKTVQDTVTSGVDRVAKGVGISDVSGGGGQPYQPNPGGVLGMGVGAGAGLGLEKMLRSGLRGEAKALMQSAPATGMPAHLDATYANLANHPDRAVLERALSNTMPGQTGRVMNALNQLQGHGTGWSGTLNRAMGRKPPGAAPHILPNPQLTKSMTPTWGTRAKQLGFGAGGGILGGLVGDIITNPDSANTQNAVKSYDWMDNLIKRPGQ